MLGRKLFANQLNMDTLRLDYNSVTSLSGELLSSMKKMRVLYLGNNAIVAIDRLVFVGLINLELVYMMNNPISDLMPSLVERLCSTNYKCKIFM